MKSTLDNTSMSTSFDYRTTSRNEVFASIIIPVYNTQNDIGRCLDSILSQTISDFEVICVDDGSTDDSSDILARYAANDSRIQVLRQENAGPSKARNHGLSQARGSYVWFVDADDTIAETALEQLQEQVKLNNEPDVVIFSYDLEPPVDENTPRWLAEARVTRNALYPAFDPDALFSEPGATPFLWRYFLRTDFLHSHDLWLWEGLHLGEDALFQFMSLPLARGIVFLNEPLYFYQCSRTGSIMDRANSDFLRKARCHLEIIRLVASNWNERDILDGMRDQLTSWAIDFFYHQIMRVLSADRDELILLFVNQLKSWANLSFDRIAPRSRDQLCEIIGSTSCDTMRSVAENHPWLPATAFVYRYWNDARAGMNALLQSSLVNTVKLQVKTVAIYYHRLCKGGAEYATRALAKQWERAGYRVVVIVDEGSNPSSCEGIDALTIPIPRDDEKTSYAPRAHALANILRQNHVDVLVYHAWNSGWLPWDLATTKMCGCAFAVFCNSMFSIREIHGDPYFGLQPYTYAPADAVACLSEADKAFWDNFNGNVHKVVNPLDPHLFTVGASELKGATLAWIGRFSEEKRPEDALFILKKVRERVPSARLVMLGSGEDGTYDVHLQGLAEELGIHDAVEFCGYVDNVSDYLEKSDLLLVTSEYEGFHLGLFEALSHGVPAVMYHLPNLSWVEHTEGVLRVPNGSVGEAARAAVDLLADRRALARAGAAARSHARSFESIDVVRQWSLIFDSLKQQHRPPSVDHETAAMWEVLLSSYRYGVSKLGERHRNELTEAYQQLERAQQQLDTERAYFNEERECLTNSPSFRIGRSITFLPRKMRTAWRVLTTAGPAGVASVLREKMQGRRT